jgi:Flp pilus assembly protein TadD
MGLLNNLFGQKKDDWQAHIDAGSAAHQRGDYRTAIARFQDALKLADAFG